MSPPNNSVELGNGPPVPLFRWWYPGVRLIFHGVVPAFLCFVVILLVLSQFANGPGKFHENYQGMKEPEVVAKLGRPYFDTRRFQQAAGNQNGEYELIWSYGFERGLTLHFNNGIVVKQSNASR